MPTALPSGLIPAAVQPLPPTLLQTIKSGSTPPLTSVHSAPSVHRQVALFFLLYLFSQSAIRYAKFNMKFLQVPGGATERRGKPINKKSFLEGDKHHEVNKKGVWGRYLWKPRYQQWKGSHQNKTGGGSGRWEGALEGNSPEAKVRSFLQLEVTGEREAGAWAFILTWKLGETLLWLSGLQTRLVSMRMQVRSLASLSGLRIWHCCEQWCRLQTWLRSWVAVAVV